MIGLSHCVDSLSETGLPVSSLIDVDSTSAYCFVKKFRGFPENLLSLSLITAFDCSVKLSYGSLNFCKCTSVLCVLKFGNDNTFLSRFNIGHDNLSLL